MVDWIEKIEEMEQDRDDWVSKSEGSAGRHSASYAVLRAILDQLEIISAQSDRGREERNA